MLRECKLHYFRALLIGVLYSTYAFMFLWACFHVVLDWRASWVDDKSTDLKMSCLPFVLQKSRKKYFCTVFC